MLNFKLKYLLLLFCFISNRIEAQKQLQFSIISTDNPTVLSSLKYKKILNSTIQVNRELLSVKMALIKEGYITANVDSMINDSSKYTAFLSIGQKYLWAQMRHASKDAEVISKLGYSERFFIHKPFNYSELSKMLNKIIVYYENNGFPFCEVKLDSVEINNASISAKLNITKNEFVKIDSFVVEEREVVKAKFLNRYLGLKNGMPYNENSFVTISTKLKQLPFLTEKKAAVIRLTDKQNKMYLFVAKKNASQFDGILGILPSSTGKTIFTGDIKIKLMNTIFKSGETFDINFRRLQTQTQDLKALVSYPYLFGLPIGADYNIKLYKKDTSFIDVNQLVGVHYYFNGLNHVKAFYKQRNSNLVSVAGLSNVSVLPEYADITTKSYGLATIIEKMDYKFNPHKGFSFFLQGSVGNRQIRKNPKISDVAYNGLLLKSTQYQIEGNIAAYLNIIKNHVIKLSSQFASLYGNTLYKNELFRIGGLKTLRGFDEESIYASTYVIPTIEYRFLFEKNSNLFLFAEGAWYENRSSDIYLKDTPIGIGAGINFETKAGIFNLSYGLGKQLGNNFDFRTGKIHAGLTALF